MSGPPLLKTMLTPDVRALDNSTGTVNGIRPLLVKADQPRTGIIRSINQACFMPLQPVSLYGGEHRGEIWGDRERAGEKGESGETGK